MRKFTPAQFLFFSLFLLPPLLIALSILKYGVDLIDWDQWEIAAFFEKAAHGSLSLADLFAQQAEYRQFFPNLIFVCLGWLTHWNIKVEMFVSLLLACLIAYNIYRLGQLTVGGNRSKLLLLTFISNLLIFSPAQFENWLLGEQIIYFIPIVCLTVSLRVALSNARRQTKLIVCLLLSTISTFSSANGIVCWLVIPPALFFTQDRKDKKLWRYAVWTIGLGLNLIVYLYDYHHPAYTPSLTDALQQPLRATLFFFNLLGAPLITSQRLMPAAAMIGATLSALFLASCLYLWKFANDAGLMRRLSVWLMLGAYSFITAIIITISRLGFGLDRSLLPRYTTFSIYLLIALCYLVPTILEDLRSAGGSRFVQNGRRIQRLLPFALASLLLLHLLNSAAAVRQMVWHKMRRLQAKACLLFIDSVPDECSNSGKGIPDLSIVKERLNALNDLGYLRPSLIKSNRIEDIAETSVGDSASSGRFGQLIKTESKTFITTGWASLPERGEPADAVLLTYQKENAAPVIFALSEMKIEQPSFTALFVKNPAAEWRWQKTFSLERVPVAPPVSISAWAFDATTGKAHKLVGTFIIEDENNNSRSQETGNQ